MLDLARVREVAYGTHVTFRVGVPAPAVDAFRSWLADATSGAAECSADGTAYVDV